ncbi:MAG: hypothetical protein NVV66_07920 [Cellulomonas sp.]|uniref:hypothetical protein n=1 Tax=Cellulomonas sp. TaxID=40001 RepID=UPI0025905FA8|nr:hypothetical protein [Cellulomonas sp.]MCR6704615.1 hypothetical protein [Cellulomonas sp.]
MGEEIDEAWIRFLLRLEPRRASDDVDVLLVLRRLVEHAWVDVDVARPLPQSLRPAETAGVMARMLGITIDDEQVVAPVAGVPCRASSRLATVSPCKCRSCRPRLGGRPRPPDTLAQRHRTRLGARTRPGQHQ